jgi:hypothetical protein
MKDEGRRTMDDGRRTNPSTSSGQVIGHWSLVIRRWSLVAIFIGTQMTLISLIFLYLRHLR